jgi:signal transduction histidine kinase
VSLTVTSQPPDGSRPATDVSTRGGGYGLTGMRERAELLGGTLAAGPSGSTWRVELVLPA